MRDEASGPASLQLTTAQRGTLQPYLKQFAQYAKSEQYKQDLEHRRNQTDFFQREFPTRLSGLAESDVLELVSRLWAAQIWGNKQYLAQKIISANGLEKLSDQFRRLWDTSLDVADRYDTFRENIAYLGPAALTEIMCYVEPKRCGIWNQKAREAVRVLQLESIVDPGKYHISGKEYGMFNQLCATIGAEIGKSEVPDVDLLLVDYFLYEVRLGAPATKDQVAPVVTGTHEEIQDMIEGIGTMLGFDAEKEVSVAHGARVDVVWRARIGNLGLVTYVFEVQRGGSVDSLILNLQRAKNSATVQKVIAVSDEDQLQRIERETQGLSSEFRSALSFWKVSDVRQVSENLQSAMTIIDSLGLVPSKKE